MKILIVDDDQIIIKGLINIIGRMNLKDLSLVSAGNAVDALEILKYNGIDLLITDIDMPVMNGLELIAETKGRGHCSHFIILSGFDKFEFAKKAIQFGVLDYLLKPINKTELQRLILSMHQKLHGAAAEPAELPELPIYDIEPDPERIPKSLFDIMDFMKKHYQQNLSLEQLGSKFDLHPNYICYLFQNYTNSTFLKYLDCLKLQKSVSLLLKDQNLSIEKIAVSSGFLGERQFYKVFKKYIGMTPGSFRKEYHRQPLHIPQ